MDKKMKRVNAKTVAKKVASIRATVTTFDTGEVWIDDKGNHYNIDRTPIDWKKVAEGGNK